MAGNLVAPTLEYEEMKNSDIESKTAETYRVSIYMAGDIDAVRAVCREFCFEEGLCVTVKACDFIYTGGQEAGVEVGLVQYPRFFREKSLILAIANDLADKLIEECHQMTALIMDDEVTTWMTRNPDHREEMTPAPSAPNETEGPIANKEHYKPQEVPTRYPLELTETLHVCLWDEAVGYKWTVAYFAEGKEGYDLKFVGDRPLNPRVNWDHFRELVEQGQELADKKFEENDNEF